jgi:IclR family transcriptional regulator, KDG regulon repressor
MSLFLDHGEGLTLDEMARLSGMAKPTVRRIAKSLVECGLLRQPKKRGKYSLGMKLLDFAKAVKTNNVMIDIAMPRLINLSRNVEETVAMALWDGENAVICQSIHPKHPLKVTSNEGTIPGLHYTSLGKAILAELPDEDLQHYCKDELERRTPNTLTEFNDLKLNLLMAKQEGVLIDDEEFAIGVRGLGAAIKESDGKVVGSIGIMGPSVRLTRERIREYIPMVKACADGISEELIRR